MSRSSADGFSQLGAIDPDSGRVNVVIDTPKGSRNKFKYDEDLALFKLSKVLPLGSSFPYDFGFIPGTRGEDGDALDVLLLMDEPAFTGCLVQAKLVGVIEAEQTEDGKTMRNDRLVAVCETPHNPAEIQTLEDLSKQRLDEIEHFFVSYNDMEGKKFKPVGRHGPGRARELVEEGVEQFKGSRKGDRTSRRHQSIRQAKG